MTVFPRSVGTFLMSRRDISLKDSAVSRMRSISSLESSLVPSRSLYGQFMLIALVLPRLNHLPREALQKFLDQRPQGEIFRDSQDEWASLVNPCRRVPQAVSSWDAPGP